MNAREAQHARWRRAIAEAAARDALMAALLALAQAEAAGDRSADPATAEPWRFHLLIEDVVLQLQDAPLAKPLPPEAHRLAARPQEHRRALKALARKVETMARWSLDAALDVEAHPAVLALWVARPVRRGPLHAETLARSNRGNVEAQPAVLALWRVRAVQRGLRLAEAPQRHGDVWMATGDAFLPLLVRDGETPKQHDAAAVLRRWAVGIPSRAGKAHALGDGFDVVVALLAQAYAAVAGRTGAAVFAASLTNAAADGPQRDTGPVPRFIRSALKLLAPHMLSGIGPQGITRALGRYRQEVMHDGP
jgi:hypothetical protein